MIELKELKNQIETNSLDKHFIVFKCAKESIFVVHQYAKEHCKNNACDIVVVDDVSQLPKNTLFSNDVSSNLTLLNIDKLDSELLVDQKDVATNFIWIICNKITKKISSIYQDNIVEIPRLDDWQIKDFITSRCSNLSEIQINELFHFYKNNLFRLDNELAKLEVVGDNKYDTIKNQLFIDVSNYNVFDIVNAIITRDKVKLSNIYKDIHLIEVDYFGILALLINNFQYIIDIQLYRNPTPESVGVSSKQFWAIKNYSCGFYQKHELIYIFKMLNDIDYRIKSGEINPNMILDYIICKIFSL